MNLLNFRVIVGILKVIVSKYRPKEYQILVGDKEDTFEAIIEQSDY